MKKFYLTTAIPYVNAAPHLGHALEFVQADVVSRYQRILEKEVLLLSGADENALKNVQAAEAQKIPVQEFIDKNSRLFADLAKKLNVGFDVFQKGSSSDHHRSSQKLWQLCEKAGDIYKKEYAGLYCLGCELFYEPEELDKNGECFEHPGKKLERVSEENYFFKLSKYQETILKLLETNELKIVPETRKNEALAFIKSGLKDISISRSNKRAKNWGVEVPGDPTQKIYVWFDALNIYQSGVGFGLNEEKYKKWWPADLHVIGKGILRFHAVYWPAFLLSAGLKLPREIFVHGYLTVNGQKMSKTLGNIVDPFELVKKYGVDPVRYYLLREIPAFGDGDFSEKRFREVYNADLANGLGNLVSRVAKLAEQVELKAPAFAPSTLLRASAGKQNLKLKDYWQALEEYRFNEAVGFVWEKISSADRYLDQNKPWQLKGEELEKILENLVGEILEISFLLAPFLPESAEKIKNQFQGPKIKSQPALFPRL